MSLRVFAWDANPAIDRHLYPLSNRRAAEMVDEGRGEYITLSDGRTAVRKFASAEQRIEKSIGTSNLIPFGRSYNRMMEPPTINYEIPRAGDCRSICTRRFSLRRTTIDNRSVLISRTRKVSARKIDFTSIPYRSTQPSGVTLSQPNASSSSLNSIA